MRLRMQRGVRVRWAVTATALQREMEAGFRHDEVLQRHTAQTRGQILVQDSDLAEALPGVGRCHPFLCGRRGRFRDAVNDTCRPAHNASTYGSKLVECDAVR